MFGATVARARATTSSAFAVRCQPLLQSEQWTIPIVSDEHGILQFGDPFEQNETTQEQLSNDISLLMDEIPLSAVFYQEEDMEFPPLYVSQPQATKTSLTDQGIGSSSAELSQSLYTLMLTAEIHHNIANEVAHKQEVPSRLFQETMVMDMNMESVDTDLGTLLAYGDLGPLSVDGISLEALSLDTDMEASLNDTYQSGNALMRETNHQPNASNPLAHQHTPGALSDSTSEKTRNVGGQRNRNLETKPKYDTCSKQFRTSSDYEKDRRSQKKFKCDICHKQFRSSRGHQIHQRIHTGEKPFQCDICPKQFRTPSDYKTHRRTHTEKPFQCDICTKQFRISNECKIHRRTHTGEKIFQCDICLKKLSSSGSYQGHRRTHTGEKPFQCDICPTQFRTYTQYQLHRRKHTGEKPFHCDMCPKQFRTSGQHQIHRRTHTGEKPFHCEMCPKKFRTSGQHQIHRRTHTGEKPFQCDMCPKQFIASSNCLRHRRTHVGETRYTCYWCNENICSKRALIKHIRKCSLRNVS